MKTLIIHPANKEQLDALKAFMKALKIPFEKRKPTYDPQFVLKIKESRNLAKNGEARTMNITDL